MRVGRFIHGGGAETKEAGSPELEAAPGRPAWGCQRTVRTLSRRTDMPSAKIGHVWTAPVWQVRALRRVAGRFSHVFGLLARFA